MPYDCNLRWNSSDAEAAATGKSGRTDQSSRQAYDLVGRKAGTGEGACRAYMDGIDVEEELSKRSVGRVDEVESCKHGSLIFVGISQGFNDDAGL